MLGKEKADGYGTAAVKRLFSVLRVDGIEVVKNARVLNSSQPALIQLTRMASRLEAPFAMSNIPYQEGEA